MAPVQLNRILRAAGLCAASALSACVASGDEACPNEPGVICNYIGNGEAGLGEDGAPAAEVSLYLPQDLTFGPDDQPYVLDWNNHRVRTLVDGKVETVVGTGYLGDAKDGPAKEASLNHPTHINFDDQGRMILSAWHNSKVMRYDPKDETLSTMCGTGMRDYGGDGGPAPMAILDLPVATAFDSSGRLYVMDQANQRIRRIDQDDVITTVVGPNAQFEPTPAGMTPVCSTDAMGVERCKLCKVEDAEADPMMCAARKPQGFLGDETLGTDALLYQPFSQSAPPVGRLEMGPDDVLYFCDTGNHRVRAYDTESGEVKTVAGSGPDSFDMTFKGGYKGDGGAATKAQLQGPTDVAVRKDGALFIADTKNSCVRMVDKKGKISTVAGQCGKRGYEGDGGEATAAKLNRPYGVTLGPEGDLYIADTHNNVIRVVHGPF